MTLSPEERERIREEEWVRLQAREDFNKHLGRNPFSLRENRGGAAVWAVIAFVVVVGIVATAVVEIATSH